ncbi:MAG: hypothetical protein WAN61_01460 [Minisyncoccia bacterium]
MPYNNYKPGFKKFGVKKPVRSFRDLEVYQKTLECSVLIDKDILPALEKVKDPKIAKLSESAMSIPLDISEAHSLRFADSSLALGYIEKAMAGCNRMSVYLDHIKGLYGDKVKTDLIEDLITRYTIVRSKIFRLELSWKKFMSSPSASESNVHTLRR